MTLTTLPDERSFSFRFTTFAHVACHASSTRCRLVSLSTRNVVATPALLLSLHPRQLGPAAPVTSRWTPLVSFVFQLQHLDGRQPIGQFIQRQGQEDRESPLTSQDKTPEVLTCHKQGAKEDSGDWCPASDGQPADAQAHAAPAQRPVRTRHIARSSMA